MGREMLGSTHKHVKITEQLIRMDSPLLSGVAAGDVTFPSALETVGGGFVIGALAA